MSHELSKEEDFIEIIHYYNRIDDDYIVSYVDENGKYIEIKNDDL